MTRYKTKENNTDIAKWLFEDIPLVKCGNKNAIRQEELSTFFSAVDQTNLWCIDWDKNEKLLL